MSETEETEDPRSQWKRRRHGDMALEEETKETRTMETEDAWAIEVEETEDSPRQRDVVMVNTRHRAGREKTEFWQPKKPNQKQKLYRFVV